MYGLATHFNKESNLSHVVHLLSYGICFFTFLKAVKFRLPLYLLAAIYPFAYHANCAWMTYSQLGKLNGVCLYVVVMLPLGAFWILSQREEAPQ